MSREMSREMSRDGRERREHIGGEADATADSMAPIAARRARAVVGKRRLDDERREGRMAGRSGRRRRRSASIRSASGSMQGLRAQRHLGAATGAGKAVAVAAAAAAAAAASSGTREVGAAPLSWLRWTRRRRGEKV